MATDPVRLLWIAMALICVPWLSGCMQVRETVVISPLVEGFAVDETGTPVSGVRLTVIRQGAAHAHVDPVSSDPDGHFVIPLVTQTRTRWAPPMVGGTYRTALHLHARHPGFADGFIAVGYVFPWQTYVNGVPMILFQAWASLPEELKDCPVRPEEHYAYTLATRLEALAAEPWLRDLLRVDRDRAVVLHEALQLTLDSLGRRCGYPDVLYEQALEPFLRP